MDSLLEEMRVLHQVSILSLSTTTANYTKIQYCFLLMVIDIDFPSLCGDVACAHIGRRCGQAVLVHSC